VERIGERSVTFRVQGQDEHEQVFEGTIRLAVVDRVTVVATLVRKSDALERRRLFAAAA
jgi:predicted thioesterase